MAETLEVELVYALPDRVFRCRMQLSPDATAGDAIERSGLRQAFPALPAELRVGIFSRAVKMDQPLRHGDRVEVYRPLECDPKEARRRRAREDGS